MNKLFLIVSVVLSISTSYAQENGETLFKTVCMSCHITAGRPTLAPPVFAMKRHVIQAYPNRQDFINYLVHWVSKPDASISLMPGAIRRFGLMPAIPITEDRIRRIAAFLYDTNFNMPGWYPQHYEAEHGKPLRQ